MREIEREGRKNIVWLLFYFCNKSNLSNKSLIWCKLICFILEISLVNEGLFLKSLVLRRIY